MAEKCSLCGIGKSEDSRPAYWRKGMCPRCYQKHLRDAGRLGARGGKRKSPRIQKHSEEKLPKRHTPDPPPTKPATVTKKARQPTTTQKDRLQSAFEATLEALNEIEPQLKQMTSLVIALNERVENIEKQNENLQQRMDSSVLPTMSTKTSVRKNYKKQVTSSISDTMSGTQGGTVDVHPFVKGVAKLKNLLQQIYQDLNLS